jgi:lysozyme
MIINDATIQLVKEFEGLRLAAYQDSAGVWTIGYGTTAMAGLGISPKKGDKITEAEATRLLNMGMAKFGKQISEYIKVPVNENQYGALVSLAYNIGPEAFRKSTLLKKLNAGDYAGSADQFLVWSADGLRSGCYS